MTVTASNTLAGLASRLTDPGDRERYTTILLYLQALPPEDEFRHLAEMMGLLSLLGQRLPDALAESMAQMRELTDKAGEYYGQIDERLEGLPEEIAAGVDVKAIAKEMGEAFRQQLRETGLENTAAHLRSASREITALSGQITATLKPVSQEYKSVAATISGELQKLTDAATALRWHNSQLFLRERSNAWLWQGLLGLVLLLLGGMGGMYLEKQQTAGALNHMTLQLERLQAPPAAEVTIPKTTTTTHADKRKDDRG